MLFKTEWIIRDDTIFMVLCRVLQTAPHPPRLSQSNSSIKNLHKLYFRDLRKTSLTSKSGMLDEHFHSIWNNYFHNSFHCIWLLHVSPCGTAGPRIWWQRRISHTISCATFLLLEACKRCVLQHFKSECLNKSRDQAKKEKWWNLSPPKFKKKKKNTLFSKA